jgi:4-azaleucine resistance transporter AzlC
VLLFGVSFGVLARAAGFEPVAAVVMSATTFAGSAQFAAVSVLGAGGTLAAAIGAAVLLNARYGPMGLAAAPAFVGGPGRRLLESQLVVDEAWALSSVEESQGRRFDRRLLVGAGLLLYAAWVAGTTAGVGAGGTLGDPEKLGLDAAFPALFLALLVGQLTSRRAAAAAVAGGAISLALIPVAPAGLPVIAATAACLIGLRGRRGASRAGADALPGDGEVARGSGDMAEGDELPSGREARPR